LRNGPAGCRRSQGSAGAPASRRQEERRRGIEFAERAGRMPALVRLKGRWDRAVKVRLSAAKSRGVSNRNCVAVMRGGEQRNENDQSVTQMAREDIAVNSIRSAWMGESTSERRSL